MAAPSYANSSHSTPTSPPYSPSVTDGERILELRSSLSNLPVNLPDVYLFQSERIKLDLGSRIWPTSTPCYGYTSAVEGNISVASLEHVKRLKVTLEGLAKASFMERGVLAGHVESTLFKRSLTPECDTLKELHLTPKPAGRPPSKDQPSPRTDVEAKIALPCPLVVASGDRIPFVLTIQSQSPALAALYTNVTLQLVKQLRIKAYEKMSYKETVISSGEVYDAEQIGDGAQILRGELGNGVPGRESSWTAAGVLEVKYLLRLSIKPPPCTTVLALNVPIFEGTLPVRIVTHQSSPEMDMSMPALGMIGVDAV
ncbi:hypothetical protein RhiJN_16605 [Ceratobasidium sp. AG-Ba]|nr:hypothetical protein RhiJN_16605 [Ceratobasidium sp. AG-Ba]